MGHIRKPEKVNLITGLISGNDELFSKAKTILERHFGPVDYVSDVLDFSFTDYYKEEMGGGLKRQFLGFAKLVDPAMAFRSKLISNKIESSLQLNNKRMINIDPGYIDMAKLVLFSTKDYSHRVYLNNGIFAEVTLFFSDKKFNYWPWTYPDYRTPEYSAIFNSIRSAYRDKVLGVGI